MRTKMFLVIMIVVLVVPTVADAQSWILRARAISVQPNDSSGEIGDFGSYVAVDSATTLEVDITYMFSDQIGLEVIAATTKHDLSATGGALDGASLGSVMVLPPTAILQWYIIPEGMLNLYVGAGLNFTYFYSYDLSDDLEGLGVTGVTFDNSFGLAGNLGLNINLSDRWMLNGDIKYIQMKTDAGVKVGSDTLDTVSVDINPWVFGIGVGVRF